MYKIPVYRPRVSGKEAQYVNECITSGWISSRGEFIGKFENRFSEFLGNSVHSTAVSNGTVALHLALMSLGIGSGDEVIVPSFTYVASVNAISYVGATPIFVDADKSTWNIDCEKIEEKITRKTRAIMAVHLYGLCCDMIRLKAICSKYGLKLVEDAAEAFGSTINGQQAGTFGDIATFSFFGNKTITTGEGGMVVSQNEDLIRHAAYLKSQAVSPEKEYWHEDIGFNYRMTNICAAIGVAQLEDAENVLTKKRELSSWYRQFLGSSALNFQPEPAGFRSSHWMVSVLAADRAERDSIRAHLRSIGVETRPFFYPAHLLPMYRQREGFSTAESLSVRGINLPSWPDLTIGDVETICNHIKSKLSE